MDLVMEKSESVQVEQAMKKSGPQRRVFIVAQLSLRLLAFCSTLIAISVMLTATQTVTIFTFQFRAHYSYSSAFRFLVGADAVVCAASLVSLMWVYLLRRSELRRSWSDSQLTNNYFFLFIHDTAMLVLMASGCAASTAVGYVGKHGEAKMMWQPVCHEVSRFCRTMLVGSAFSYLAFFGYVALTLVSARRLITAIPSATAPAISTPVSDI